MIHIVISGVPEDDRATAPLYSILTQHLQAMTAGAKPRITIWKGRHAAESAPSSILRWVRPDTEQPGEPARGWFDETRATFEEAVGRRYGYAEQDWRTEGGGGYRVNKLDSLWCGWKLACEKMPLLTITPESKWPEKSLLPFQGAIDAIDTAWGIIANVSQGDWSAQKEDWVQAAARWQKEWMPRISRLRAGEPEEVPGTLEVTAPEPILVRQSEALRVALDGLEKLSRLGYGQSPGNSRGNELASHTLATMREILSMPNVAFKDAENQPVPEPAAVRQATPEMIAAELPPVNPGVVSGASATHSVTPAPAGIRPPFVVLQERADEINAALMRYKESGLTPPLGWFEEVEDCEARVLEHTQEEGFMSAHMSWVDRRNERRAAFGLPVSKGRRV